MSAGQLVTIVDATGHVAGVSAGGALAISASGGSGATFALKLTPAVTAATYAAGNCVGGLLTLNVASAGAGLIQDVAIWDKSANKLQLDILFFDANPTGSTITDKTNVTIVAADMAKIIGGCHLADFFAVTTGGAFGQALNIGLNYTVAGLLYAAIIARGAVVYSSTSDIFVTVSGTD